MSHHPGREYPAGKLYEGCSIIQRKLFFENFLIEPVAVLSTKASDLLDGLIIGILPGASAMAAHGPVSPFFSPAGILAGMMGIGRKYIGTPARSNQFSFFA